MSSTTEASRPRRRSPKGELRRQQILEAALQVFARDGYSNASIAEVAAQIGLTLPGLLHYFPSKVAMLLAVLELRDVQAPRLPELPDGMSLEQAVSAPAMAWPRLLEQLRLVNRTNARMQGVIKAFSLLNAESLIQDHPAQAWFQQRSGLVLAWIADSLRQAQQAGEANPALDPDQVAAEIIAMMDGLQLLWLRRPNEVDLGRYFEDYLARLEIASAAR